MVNRLFKLRYLHACKPDKTNRLKSVDGAISGIKVPGGIGCLKALQKLCLIRVDGTKVDILFKELGDLTQLRTLGIDNLRNEYGRKLCGCIEKMKQLESLMVASTSENEAIDLESLSSPPQFLGRLVLQGRLKKLPTSLTQLQNLRKIIFASSMLEDDPLEVLENMHDLLELSISYDAYVGEKLCFKEGAVPKLKRLELFNLRRLHLLKIQKTALPVLEELGIGRCPQMKEVPFRVQSLQNLKHLLFDLMPLEFIAFQDFLSVSRVPQVLFSCQDEQG